MAMLHLNEQLAKAAVFGGTILGGGGGGWIEEGLRVSQMAIAAGDPVLIDIEDLDPQEYVATVGLVGAPAAKERYVKPQHYLEAITLLRDRLDKPLSGIITNENGATATVNGWLQSALLSLPVVDVPCNGRAHPTAVMGAMGLNRLPGYVSQQAGAGGRPERRVGLFVEGTIESTSALIRQASIQAGGLIAVARNPVSAAYAAAHGAPKAIKQAIALGERYLAQEHKGAEAMIAAAAEYLGGEIVVSGKVSSCDLSTQNGFDVGRAVVEQFELTFWNEYMTLEKSGKRIAAFPDLIMTFDSVSGRPLVTAEVHSGQSVTVLRVSRENLILGAGMKDKDLLAQVQDVIGKSLLEEE